ncbi:MAG: ATP-dependent metallopeptidase FtsH/Yme1/Tma family protein [Bryobacteraceae bacterium]
MTVSTKRIAFLFLFATVNVLAWLALRRHADVETPPISYSRFLNEVEAGQVARVVIKRQTQVEGDYLDNRGRFRTRVPSNDPDLYWTLRENGVDMEIDESAGLLPLAAAVLPIAILIALLARRRAKSKPVPAVAAESEPAAFQSL